MEREVDINSKEYGLDVFAKMNSFREENKFCDFIIKTGEKRIPVHRCVLAAGSEYFDCMLSNDTKERHEGIVEIRDVDSSSISKCIEFMYTGKAFVSDEKRVNLLHVAHMLRLHRLYNGIASFMGNQLDSETFFTTREIANRYDCSGLIAVCDNFALRNFRAIAKMDDFKKIEVKYLDFLLSADRLKESDRVKCKALMAWVNYDLTRAASLFSMMRHIEFTNVPLSYRKFLMDHDATVSKSIECFKLVMKSIINLEKVKASDTSLDSCIIVLDHSSMKMKRLDVETGVGTELLDMHEQMRSKTSSVVILDEYLYALMDDGSNYRIKYKECNARWEAVAQRNGHWGLAVVLNDRIYVTEHDHYSDQIERYNPSENQWTFIPNRTNDVAYTAVAVAEECFFEFGGRFSNNFITSGVHMFNPESSTWTEAASLKQFRYNASAVTHDNIIYVFGGSDKYDYLSNLEIFRPSSNTTELVSLQNFAGREFMCHSQDGLIYLIGEYSELPPTIRVYNPKMKALTNEVTMDDMSVRRCDSVLAFIE